MTLVEAKPKAAGGDVACMDGPWELPEGWVWARIGDIASLRGEKADPKQEGALPFVGMDDIEPNGLSILRTRPFAELKSSGNRFHVGDVLYGRLRPYLNKTAVASESGACSGELLAIKPAPFLEPRFLQLFLHTRRFVNTAMSIVNGDRPRIDFGTIAEFNFPLAPLAEQRRIVARIDELFAEIAEGEAALREARKGLDLFRRALLKAAVTGELTQDWRAENRQTETGHDLLNRIRVQRKTKAPAKSRSRGASRLASLDTSNLSELPEGWIWTSWSDVGSSQNGRPFPSSAYTDSGVRLLRPGNLFADGSVRWTNKNTKHLPEKFAEENDDLIVREGELVINLTAQSLKDEFLGRVCITSTGESCLLNQRLARLTPFLIDSRYMLLVFKSTLFRGFVNGLNSGSLIQHMFTSQIERFVFPLPPPAEIDEILRRISDALSAVNDTAALLDAEAADAARLRQSVLKAAFEGLLVSQDPADEPASSVLARRAASKSAKVIVRRRGRT